MEGLRKSLNSGPFSDNVIKVFCDVIKWNGAIQRERAMETIGKGHQLCQPALNLFQFASGQKAWTPGQLKLSPKMAPISVCLLALIAPSHPFPGLEKERGGSEEEEI